MATSTKGLNNRFVILLLTALAAAGGNQVLASASPTETVMELTEGSGEVTSSSTSDRMEARQLVAEAESYYANPAAPLGNELTQQVQQLKQVHPEFSTGQAVDFIYERALKQ